MTSGHHREVTAGETIRFQILESASSDFQNFCDVACGSILRHLPGRRTVYKATSDGRTILLKLYEVHAKQQRDAGREWKNAVALAEAGMEIPKPLFRAKTESGQLAVAFEFIPDGETVDRALDGADDVTKTAIFAQLISLHAKQHGMGWYQSDDHLGNYIWSHGKLWMLDAGTCELMAAPLSDSPRVKNMAVLAANIPLGMRTVYDRVFPENYSRTTPGLEAAIAIEIQNRSRRYAKKTQRACSEFEHHKQSGKEWLACRDIPADLKARMLEDPDQFFENTPWLKDGNTCTVVEVKHEGKSYILKRYNEKPLSYRLQHMLMKPRALASWTNGHVLRLFGIPTPRPWACLLLKNGPLMRKSYLLMGKEDGAALDQISEETMDQQLPILAEQFKLRWHELDTLQATHGDMKSGNFMMNDAGQLSLIDLDGMVFHTSATAHQRAKEKDMARFLRNWEKRPDWVASYRDQVSEG